jgi:hypothetical protein
LPILEKVGRNLLGSPRQNKVKISHFENFSFVPEIQKVLLKEENGIKLSRKIYYKKIRK